MTKPKIIKINGRTFECHYSPEFHGVMCAVSIYEVVRPTWKIFRTSYKAYKTFWVNDYETIYKGIVAMVVAYLEDEADKEYLYNKWLEADK